MRFGPAKSMLSRQDESRGATDKIGGGKWWEVLEKRGNNHQTVAEGKLKPGQFSFPSHSKPPIYNSL